MSNSYDDQRVATERYLNTLIENEGNVAKLDTEKDEAMKHALVAATKARSAVEYAKHAKKVVETYAKAHALVAEVTETIETNALVSEVVPELRNGMRVGVHAGDGSLIGIASCVIDFDNVWSINLHGGQYIHLIDTKEVKGSLDENHPIDVSGKIIWTELVTTLYNSVDNINELYKQGFVHLEGEKKGYQILKKTNRDGAHLYWANMNASESIKTMFNLFEHELIKGSMDIKIVLKKEKNQNKNNKKNK
jgi:hypothetical protein